MMPGKSTLNTTAADEHVPETKRKIRGIKGCTRAIWSTVPFNKFPGRIVFEMILVVALWLNAFLPINGISQTYHPRTIMTYRILEKSKHCRVDFGTYSETHEDAPPTNTTA